MAATVVFSPVGNGFQWFNPAGLVLSGGKINTYLAGTTTPAATYTDNTGTVANANPIILDSTGRYAQEIWLDITLAPYKFVITDSLGVTQFTLDNIPATVSATSSNINYLAPWTGAIQSTVFQKFAVVRSVFDFMTQAQITDCQSYSPAIDATSSVQAAISSLPSSGGTILFPPGGYLISSVTVNKQCFLQGSGQLTFGTLIIPKNANSVVFDLTSSSITIRDMYFGFGPTQTGGAYIKFDTTSSICYVENVTMDAWWIGIWITGISSFGVKHCRLTNGVVGSGQGIKVDSGINMLISDVVCTNSSGARPLSGIAVTACGDLSIEYCQLIQCVNGCFLAPSGTSVVTSVRSVNSFYDNCGSYGLLVQPQASTATIQRCQFTQCWFSSAGTNGILLDAATNSGTIDGIEFIAPEVFLNTSHGINLSKPINTKIIGGQIAGNGGNGILVQANTSNIDIIGATIGPVAGITFNTTNAIQILTGTTNNLLIEGNDVRNTGGVGAISDSSSGSNRRKVDNRGFNSAGTVAITVTASPFTYTAGDTPETVYVNTGTVSLITVEGVGVYSETNVTVRLGPGKSMVVTYTVAPGMATSKD